MNRLLAAVRARLVDDWRQAHAWWSVRLQAAGAIVLPLMMMVPSMPGEVQALLPAPLRATIAALWCMAAIGTRLIAQKKA